MRLPNRRCECGCGSIVECIVANDETPERNRSPALQFMKKSVKKLLDDLCRTVGHEAGPSCSRCGHVTILPGTLLPVVGAVPKGYLPCDGRLVSNSAYPELAAAMGSHYGGEEDSFYLPDLRTASRTLYIIKT